MYAWFFIGIFVIISYGDSMIEEFSKYVSYYDMDVLEIRRKYYHSLRVMNLARKYAKLLNFSDEDIKLASVIGLLHDIGRFDQFKMYHTFDDFKSIDHADYGVQLLQQNHLIKRFYQTDNEEDYHIIFFAIKNHNKLVVNNRDCNERYMMHAQLVRDVDKLDLIFLVGDLKEVHYLSVNEDVSFKVMEAVKKHISANKRDVMNVNDKIALKFCFAFDINYGICLKELRRNFVHFYDAIDDKYYKLRDVYLEVINYIDNKLNE